MKRLASCLATLLVVACSARDVSIENAWARATPPGSTVAAVYAEVTARTDDEIVTVTTASAERIEMHTSTNEDGVMKMRPLETLPLRANEPVTFAAGGLHLMLIGLREPLVANSSLALTFHFRYAAPLSIDAKVVAPGDDGHAP